MPRYYFNLHECGPPTEDEEGVELADLAQARTRALAQARSIMAAELNEGRLCLDCRIEVLDADRRVALHLPFREAVTLTGV